MSKKTIKSCRFDNNVRHFKEIPLKIERYYFSACCVFIYLSNENNFVHLILFSSLMKDKLLEKKILQTNNAAVIQNFTTSHRVIYSNFLFTMFGVEICIFFYLIFDTFIFCQTTLLSFSNGRFKKRLWQKYRDSGSTWWSGGSSFYSLSVLSMSP